MQLRFWFGKTKFMMYVGEIFSMIDSNIYLIWMSIYPHFLVCGIALSVVVCLKIQRNIICTWSQYRLKAFDFLWSVITLHRIGILWYSEWCLIGPQGTFANLYLIVILTWIQCHSCLFFVDIPFWEAALMWSQLLWRVKIIFYLEIYLW